MNEILVLYLVDMLLRIFNIDKDCKGKKCSECDYAYNGICLFLTLEVVKKAIEKKKNSEKKNEN